MLDRPEMPKCAKDIHKRAHKKTKKVQMGENMQECNKIHTFG